MTLFLGISLCFAQVPQCVQNNPHEQELTSTVLTVIKRSAMPTQLPTVELMLDRTPQAERRRSLVDDDLMNFPEITHLRLYAVAGNPFAFDFYFYGTHEEAIALLAVDMRTFFHRRLPTSGTERLNEIRRLHAHFSEYERRSVFYSVEDQARPVLRSAQELATWILSREDHLLPLTTFTLTNNCRGAGNFEFQWPGYIKGYFQLPPAFINGLLVQFDKVYNCERQQWDGIGIKEAQTEVRFNKFYTRQFSVGMPSMRLKDLVIRLWSSFFEEDYQWYALGNFGEVEIPMTHLLEQWPMPAPWEPALLTQETKEAIPYEEFTSETLMKSNYVRMMEALSYTQTWCRAGDPETAPRNFEVPEFWEKMSQVEFWHQNSCLIVPMTFRYWDDLIHYPLFLSKFEVDGVYTGRTLKHHFGKLGGVNETLLQDKTQRVPYLVAKYINAYSRAEVVVGADTLSLRLHNDQGRSFILAHVPWERLRQEYRGERQASSFVRDYASYEKVRGIESLVGIEPRPLSYSVTEVTSTLAPATPMYGLFYDGKSDMILNHHDPKVGVEQWILRWRAPQQLVLDFVSHERIVPLRRFIIECPGCAEHMR